MVDVNMRGRDKNTFDITIRKIESFCVVKKNLILLILIARQEKGLSVM